MAEYRVTIHAVERYEWEAYVEADSIEEVKKKIDNREYEVGDDDFIEQICNETDKPITLDWFELPGIEIELVE